MADIVFLQFAEVDVKLVFKEVTSKFLRRRIVEVWVLKIQLIRAICKHYCQTWFSHLSEWVLNCLRGNFWLKVCNYNTKKRKYGIMILTNVLQSINGYQSTFLFFSHSSVYKWELILSNQDTPIDIQKFKQLAPKFSF